MTVDESSPIYQARKEAKARRQAVIEYAQQFHKDVLVDTNPNITTDAAQDGAFVAVTLWVPFDKIMRDGTVTYTSRHRPTV